MNKRQAEAIARDIERHGLRVTGFRRYDYGRKGASWAVDVVDTKTGYPFTVDDAEQWEERKHDAGMEAVAATPGRPPLSPDGVRMVYHSIAMPDVLWAWAEQGDTRSANVRKAVDAVRLLEQAIDAGWTVEISHDIRYIYACRTKGGVSFDYQSATLIDALHDVLGGLGNDTAEAQQEAA